MPETLQDARRLGFELAAGVTTALKLATVRVKTVEGPVSFSVKELVMVMDAAALFDGSAMLVAVSVIPVAWGRIWGAVYVPLASTTPHDAPVQPLPDNAQMIPGFGFPAEATVATNACDAPSSTEFTLGETDRETSLETCTEADALLDESSALVACTVNVGGKGSVPGAK